MNQKDNNMPKGTSIKKVWIISVISFVLIIIVVSIGLASGQTPQQTTIQEPTTKPTVKTSYVFDVPNLLTLNIDQVRESIGQPVDKDIEPTSQQLNNSSGEWDNTFRKGGEELLVTFNVKTRKIIDLFISGDNKALLLEKTGLYEGDARYTLKFVQALSDPELITGVIITSN